MTLEDVRTEVLSCNLFHFRDGLQCDRRAFRADADWSGDGRAFRSSGTPPRRHGGQHRPLGSCCPGAPLVPVRGGRAVCSGGPQVRLHHSGDFHPLLLRRRMEFLFQMSAHASALLFAACAE
jgi:hypothetical protein